MVIEQNRENPVQKLFYILLASPVLFLLVNRYPYFLILSMLVVIFLSLIFFLSKRKITSYHYPLLLLLSLIYAYFIISYFFSGQYISNFFSYNFLRTDGNFFFSYILFFALAVPFFDYRKLADYYFKITFFVFSIFALIGITEFLLGYSALMIKEDSTVGNMFMGLNFAHNATGSIYALVSIFALIFFLEEKAKKIKILYSAVFALCAAALFLTKSRGSYLAFMVAVVFVLGLHFKSIKKFFISLGSMAAASVALLFITDSIDRFINIFTTEGTAAIRLGLWERAWSLFTRSPIFGAGFGRYNDIQSLLTDNLAGREGFLAFFLHPRFLYDFGHAHNSYLQLLAETGIIGLGLLLSFWGLSFYIIFRSFRASRDNFSRKAFLAGLSTIVVLLALSFTEHYLSATTIMVGSSMIVSICIGLGWQQNSVKKDLKKGINA